ncbi:Histone acetyltransferase type B catalytic subunit-like 2, partial [Homarus americanus]
DGEEKTFEVYLCDISATGFSDYHERIQTFILWYIDAASYIDVDDDKWRFFVTYEKYMVNGSPQYAYTGYTTVYEYYAYPANIRPRISQMLVLPPFQRLVEDPSDNFARLRDFIDSKNCMKLESFQSSKLLQGFSESMVEEAKKKLKLNKRQIRRVYEILRLHKEDRDMEKLKKVLKPEEYAATMTITSKDQRLESLERQYAELEEHYLHVLERLASADLS